MNISLQTPKPADLLVKLTLSSGATFYLDQYGQPFVSFKDRASIAYAMTSTTLVEWMLARYWEKYGKGPGDAAIKLAVNTLKGKAFSENKKVTLHNRIARSGESIIFDMGDDHRFVIVNPRVWFESPESPVKFRRFAHQSVQVSPIPGGSIEEFLDLLNLSGLQDRRMLATYLVAIFVPDIPKCILMLSGDAGSAKSTTLKMIRSLVDPSQNSLLILPRDVEGLAQIANHNYFVPFDNLSSLKTDISDMICALVTGVSFTKRQLYTDAGDIIMTQMSAIGLTSINEVGQRSDLYDRTCLIDLERISRENRQPESQIWSNFESAKPAILGAIFSLLSEVLEVVDTLKYPTLPRMADFARYQYATAKVLGYPQREFEIAMDSSTHRQHMAAIETSVVGTTIHRLMRERQQWTGTSTALFRELRAISDSLSDNLSVESGFPSAPLGLWKSIKNIRSSLYDLGIAVTKSEKSEGTFITITKSDQGVQTAATPAITATDFNGSYGSQKPFEFIGEVGDE